MKLLKAFLEGLAGGVVSGLTGPAPASAAGLKIRELCAAVGWAIAGEHGRDVFEVRFRTPLGGRSVIIHASPEYAVLSVLSAYLPSVVPEHFARYLLHRNREVPAPGGWLESEAGDRVGFKFAYIALMDGLTPASFGFIVNSMVKEVSDMEAGLNEKGLL